MTWERNMLKNYNILAGFLLFLLTSCASTIPSIYLQSADITMDLHRPAYGITDVAISKDGSVLLTSDNALIGTRLVLNPYKPGRGTLRLWDLVQGKQIRTISIRDIQYVMSVSISPDKRYALAGGKPAGHNSSLSMWDLMSGEQVRAFPDIKDEVFSTSFSPDGKYIMAAHRTIISLFKTETGALIRQFDARNKSGFFTAGLRFIAAFTPDGKYILTGGEDATLKLWDAATGKPVRSFVGHKPGPAGGITGIAISSDGKYAFTCAANDSSARLWDIATGKQIQTFQGLKVFFLGAWGTALSPDNKYGVIVALPLGIWDIASGKQITPLQMSASVHIMQEKPGTAVYNPNGKTILGSANDAAVRIFDTATGKEQVMLVGFDNGEWIVITTEGYYNASEKGADYLTANLGGTDYSVEQFYDIFYRPDIVRAKLKGEDIHDLVTITMNDAVKNPPPVVEFTSLPSNTDQQKAKLCYQVKSTGGGIGEVRLFHNGKLIQSDGYYRAMTRSSSEKQQNVAMNGRAIYEDMRSVSLKSKENIAPTTSKPKGETFEDCKEVESINGENDVSCASFNGSDTVKGDRRP